MASDLRCEEVLHILEEDDEIDTSREFETMMAGSSDPNPGLDFDNAGTSSDQMIPNTGDRMAGSSDNIQDQEDQLASTQFCSAYKDSALLDNHQKVLKNMLDLEEFYLPDISIYDDVQDEIQIHMRKIVTEWMLDVCIDQRCHTDVFLLSTNIMDRFLAQVKLPKRQFQLLGATSIFLASKMVEPSPISALTLTKCTADTYDREELLSMELLILSKLKWDLTAITSYDYLDYMINSLDLQPVSVMAEVETKVRRNTEKLVTLCATDETFMSMPPSLVAASALLTALEQDKSISNKVNLNQIIGCIKHNTNLEMAHLKNCKHLMEKIFLPTSEQQTSDFRSGHSSTTDPSYSSTHSHSATSNIRHRSRSFHVSENVPSSEGGTTDQTTPTEVFSVSALHVT